MFETLETRWAMAGAAWPVYGHDIASTGKADVSGPTTGELAWSAMSDGSLAGALNVIGEDALYIDNRAINLDGSIRWELTIDGSTGLTPVAVRSDGALYYVNSGLGKVYLVNPAAGTIDNAGQLSEFGAVQWRLTVASGIGIGTLDRTGNLLLRGPNSTNLFSVSPGGQLNWTYSIPEGTSEPPAVGPDGTIYIGSEANTLYALRSSDGSLKWKYRASDHLHASPAVDSQGNIYVTSRDFVFYKVSSAGKLVWKSTVKVPSGGLTGNGWNDGGVALDEGNKTVVFPGYHGIYAYNTDTGKLKWSYTDTITSNPWTHPAIDANGHVYFVESMRDRVIALNSAGAKMWEGATPDNSSDVANPILGADGTLYVSGPHGDIIAYHDGGIGRPTITKLTASADPVETGASLTLTAVNVTDYLGAIDHVDFYRDANGNGTLEVGTDEFIAAATTSYDTAQINLFAPTTAGAVIYLAQATDNVGYKSNVVSRTVTVVPPSAAPAATYDLALASLDWEQLTDPTKSRTARWR